MLKINDLEASLKVCPPGSGWIEPLSKSLITICQVCKSESFHPEGMTVNLNEEKTSQGVVLTDIKKGDIYVMYSYDDNPEGHLCFSRLDVFLNVYEPYQHPKFA